MRARGFSCKHTRALVQVIEVSVLAPDNIVIICTHRSLYIRVVVQRQTYSLRPQANRHEVSIGRTRTYNAMNTTASRIIRIEKFNLNLKF